MNSTPPPTQPDGHLARLMRVISHRAPHPDRRLALDLLLRAAAAAGAALLILGLLPAITRAVA